MDPWAVLELDRGSADESMVKRAYARLLKAHRPDADPVGFRRVRDAYEAAIRIMRDDPESLVRVHMPPPLERTPAAEAVRDAADAIPGALAVRKPVAIIPLSRLIDDLGVAGAAPDDALANSIVTWNGTYTAEEKEAFGKAIRRTSGNVHAWLDPHLASAMTPLGFLAIESRARSARKSRAATALLPLARSWGRRLDDEWRTLPPEVSLQLATSVALVDRALAEQLARHAEDRMGATRTREGAALERRLVLAFEIDRVPTTCRARLRRAVEHEKPVFTRPECAAIAATVRGQPHSLLIESIAKHAPELALQISGRRHSRRMMKIAGWIVGLILGLALLATGRLWGLWLGIVIGRIGVHLPRIFWHGVLPGLLEEVTPRLIAMLAWSQLVFVPELDARSGVAAWSTRDLAMRGVSLVVVALGLASVGAFGRTRAFTGPLIQFLGWATWQPPSWRSPTAWIAQSVVASIAGIAAWLIAQPAGVVEYRACMTAVAIYWVPTLVDLIPRLGLRESSLRLHALRLPVIALIGVALVLSLQAMTLDAVGLFGKPGAAEGALHPSAPRVTGPP